MKTNSEDILQIALQGAISHTAVPSTYTISWDGKPRLGIGRGGIIYNIKLGDPCFGWANGENIEPGVSADASGDDRGKAGFKNLSNVGDRVRLLSGDAKGEWGKVVGKADSIPGVGVHIIIHFGEETMDKLAIGDKIQIRAGGVGLKLVDYPKVSLSSCTPELINNWGIEEKEGKLHVPVTKTIPVNFVGQGAGGTPVQSSGWEIQTQSPDAAEHCKDLRLGDLVLLEDTQSIYGLGYHKGASTVGVAITGPSSVMGHGICVTPLLSCINGQIIPKLDPELNLKGILELEA